MTTKQAPTLIKQKQMKVVPQDQAAESSQTAIMRQKRKTKDMIEPCWFKIFHPNMRLVPNHIYAGQPHTESSIVLDLKWTHNADVD